MENSAKALILFSATLAFSCSGREKPAGENPARSPIARESDSIVVERALASLPKKHPIGKGLYCDSLGKIYLKTGNRRMRNPTSENQYRPDSIFHSKVSLRDSGISRSLSEILDTASFARIDNEGVYFEDSAFIYVYSIWPYPDQFFAVKKAGARFLDKEKQYLLAGGKLYSHGKIVEDIDVQKARAVRFRKKDGKGFWEFITDGKVLIHDFYALDEERLSLLGDLPVQEKERIRRRFFKAGSESRGKNNP